MSLRGKGRCVCTVNAFASAVLFGFAGAILHFEHFFALQPCFLWALLGLSAVYLAALIVAFTLGKGKISCRYRCVILNTLLAAILGAVLFCVLLLGVGTSISHGLCSVLVGLLIAFFSLTLTSTACLVKCLALCEK